MPGSVTISIEIELAWGWHDVGGSEMLSEEGRAERDALARLLTACDAHSIPISFNIVGHLLKESCGGAHLGPHPKGWFDADPGTDIDADPHFYAPDMVKMIQEHDVNHEICTHTFSHVICGNVSKDVQRWELEEVTRLHRDAGLGDPKSLVPPRHSKPSPAVLQESSIKVIRVPQPPPVATTPRRAIQRLSSWLFNRGHPTFQPGAVKDGILETSTTPYPSLTADHLPNGCEAPHPLFQTIPLSVRKRTHRQYLQTGIDRALNNGENAHFSSHLQNLANDHQLSVIEDFMSTLSAKIDSGLTVTRMRDLDSFANIQERPSL